MRQAGAAGAIERIYIGDDAAALEAAFERAIDSPARAVLLAIATDGFVPSIDVREVADATVEAAPAFERAMRRHRAMRALESSGKAIAAAICGPALGLPLELALVAHHRVAGARDGARFGLPEASFGLVAGAGGTQRLGRLLGYEAAARLVVEGTALDAAAAARAGILDAVVEPGREEAVATAWLRDRLREDGPFLQPWDGRGGSPGGRVQSPAGAGFFMAATAMLHARTYGNAPAAVDALSCLYEGLQTDLDTGLKIEARYCIRAARSPQARNALRVLHFGPEIARPAGTPYRDRVLGAYRAELAAMEAEGLPPAIVARAAGTAGMPAPHAGSHGRGAFAETAALGHAWTDEVDRLVAVQSLEAARCLEEGLAARPIDADVAAVREWGYPAFRGGPLGWIDTAGAAAFVERARGLAARWGPRFDPPESLLAMADRGGRFYTEPGLYRKT